MISNIIQRFNSKETMDYRKNVVNTLCEEIPELNNEQLSQIEKSIYNWTIEFSEKKNIIKAWNDKRFLNAYENKSLQIYASLFPNSYLYTENSQERNELINRILNNEIECRRIAFLRPHELLPNKWNEYTEQKNKKDDNICNSRQIAKTDQFICSKCKKRECSYYELQVRSADESTTIFITCLNCTHRWRIG